MLTRRGFSLVELLVGIILVGIIGLATSRLMRTMLSGTAAQVAVATNQGNIRNGALAVPLELREIGYDTIPLAAAAPYTTSDLEAIAEHRLTFRAMRGFGTTCQIAPSLQEYRIRKPIWGQRQPLVSDGLLLFVENDPNLATDDQWVPMVVSAIDLNSTCTGDPAIAITLVAVPELVPGGAAMAPSNVKVGGPVRWYERMEYGPYVDPVTNEVSLGARSLSLGQAALQPMIGPLPDTTAFALTYYDGAGAELDPTVAAPIQVRAIGISLTGVTSSAVSLAGSAKRSRSLFPVTTRVALRNTLRP